MEKVKKNIEALRMKPKKRSLEELSLIDDFLFQEIISRGEAGEEKAVTEWLLFFRFK